MTTSPEMVSPLARVIDGTEGSYKICVSRRFKAPTSHPVLTYVSDHLGTLVYRYRCPRSILPGSHPFEGVVQVNAMCIIQIGPSNLDSGSFVRRLGDCLHGEWILERDAPGLDEAPLDRVKAPRREKPKGIRRDVDGSADLVVLA